MESRRGDGGVDHIDDAFISFRYSHNLLHGVGLTWSPGEATEGSTTLLWVLVMALPLRFGAEPFLTSKILSIVFCLSTWAVLASWVSSMVGGDERPPVRLTSRQALVGAATVFALAAYPPTALHAVSGMETTLHALLLACIVHTWRNAMNGFAARHVWAFSVACLLGVLNRPDAAIWCVPLALSFLLRAVFVSRVSAVRYLLVAVLPVVLVLIIKRSDYGHWFPLPCYVKSAGAQWTGLPHVQTWFASHHLSSALWGAGLLYACLRRRLLLLVATALSLFFLYYAWPEHLMCFEERYLFPVLPVAMALSLVGWARLIADRFPARLLGIGVLLVVSLWEVDAVAFPARIQNLVTYGTTLRTAHGRLGAALAKVASPYTRTIALGDVGALPYYSRWRVIDTMGLNDEHVAITKDQSPEYVFGRGVDAVVLISQSPTAFVPTLGHETAIYQESVRRGFVPVLAPAFSGGSYSYYLLTLVDPTRVNPQALRDAWETTAGPW